LADESKKQYEAQKAEWQKQCQDILDKSSQSSKKRAGKVSPSADVAIKRPRSSYVFFCANKRPEVASKFTKLGDISKELARMWSEVTPEEKKIYDGMAQEDKQRYEREKEALDSGDQKTTAKKRAPTRKKAPASPSKKRGPSAYMLFCSEYRNSIVDENGNKLPLGETTKRLAKMWNECDDETKKQFQSKAEEAKLAAAV